MKLVYPASEYQRLFDSSPTPYLVLAPDFTMVAANAARLRVTNTRREDIIGRPLFDVFPDNPEDPGATGVSNLRASLQRVLATRAPDAMPTQQYDIRRTAEQGGGFEERYWSPVNWPLLDDHGNVAYIVHQVEDVTDFVRMREPIAADARDAETMGQRIQELEAEMFVRSRERFEATERMRESQEQYRALINASSQVLYRMSPDWSEMRQLQGGNFLADTEKSNRNWLAEYIHPDDQPRVLAAIGEAVRTGAVFEFEHRVRRIDGSLGWTVSRAVPVRDAAGEIVEWFGAASDITERRDAEERLQASEERYRTLFANMTEGFALGEPILDSQDNPVDLRWLEVNDAFHKQTGIPRGILGRPLREYLPRIEQLWIDRFAAVALTGQAERFESFNTDTRREYDVYAFCPNAGRFAALFRDVTAQKRIQEAQKAAETALRESEARLALALKASGTAVWEMDVATQEIIPASDLHFTMLGYAPGDLKTSTEWLALIHEEDLPGVPEMIRDVIDGRRDSFWRELRLRAKDGRWHWILSQATASERDAQGAAVRLVGTYTDINERKLAEERVREAGLHDALTGLPSRALVFEFAGRFLAAARRNHAQGTFLFIDLDRFKPINDLYGHEAGDQVLQEVARRLARCVREEDLLGRLGGDEFIVVLQHESQAQPANTVAQHVIDALSQPIRIGRQEVSISASVGISHFPEHGTDVDTLIRAADLAMYQTKRESGGNYFTFVPTLDARAEQASAIEARLKRALQHGGLALHYQPVVDIWTQAVVGVEALVRLATEEGHAIPPDKLIPIAESAGLIGPLGEWVAREACRQHGAWRRQGLPPIGIAINVSPLQFRQRGFSQRLQSAVSEASVDPSCIQIEVTESTVMSNVDDAVRTLSDIRSGGIRIALDDFGTGYSSLSHLGTLPLDKLKVDQSFVKGVARQQTSRAITEAIIALGRTLNLQVVGEGIESEDALAYLREHGCDQAQGYFVSPPLSAEDFACWFHNRCFAGPPPLHPALGGK